jgi:hypothetical protein
MSPFNNGPRKSMLCLHTASTQPSTDISAVLLFAGLIKQSATPYQSGPDKFICVIKGGGPSAHYSTQLHNDKNKQ